MDIRNEKELRTSLENEVNRILEDVTKELLEMLQNRIMIDVYTKPNVWYYGGTASPTMQFLEAWGWDEIQKISGEYVTTLSMDSSTLSYDSESWLHGSPISGDARKNLDDILNLVWSGYEPGPTSSLKFGNRYLSHPRRPYWTNFLKELFDKKKLQKMIDKRLKNKFGGQIKMTGG